MTLIDSVFGEQFKPEELSELKAIVTAAGHSQFPEVSGRLVDRETFLRACVAAWHTHEAAIVKVTTALQCRDAVLWIWRHWLVCVARR